MHPYLVQQDLLDYCNKKGIHVTAYSPTGEFSRHISMKSKLTFSSQGYKVREDPVVKELAAKYDVSPVQIILAWHNARRVSFATQSKNTQHRREALKVICFVYADFECLLKPAADSCQRCRTQM